MKTKTMLLILIGVFLSGSAAAGSKERRVFLNGVDISEVRGQTFKNASVTVDDNGDVRINAPGYKVEVVESPDRTAAATAAPTKPKGDEGGPNPTLSKKYYLVTQPSPGGRAQYDFVVSINGVERRVVPAGSKQVIMEISSWLRKGENTVVIKARKNLTSGRKSTSKSDEARVMIGTGHVKDKVVEIDSIDVSMRATAADVSTRERNYTIVAQ
jgi:hypothetical protein